MTHKSRWRLRDVLSVTAVLLSGFIIAGILAYLATESENDLSSQAFAGTFQSQIPAFETFFDIRVLALRAIADSLSLYGLAINRSVSQPVRCARFCPVTFC